MRGMYSAAMLWCTSSFSAELHTDGRCVLALITMPSAISKSADSSTKMWQFPAPVSITGTVALSATKEIRPGPPRGMSTSTRPRALISSCTESRVLESSNSIAPSGTPATLVQNLDQPLIAVGRFLAAAQHDGVPGLQHQRRAYPPSRSGRDS